MTVLEILNWSTHYLKDHQIENPRLNAELLLARVLNLSKEELYAHLNAQFKKEEKEALERLIERRISGEPLQYILGHQEFWSIDFKVDPRVLIPRPETELLVEQGLSILSETSLGKTPSVLEIGTGSGAIAISLAKEVRDIFIVATDISRSSPLGKGECPICRHPPSDRVCEQGSLRPFFSSKIKGRLISSFPILPISPILRLRG